MLVAIELLTKSLSASLFSEVAADGISDSITETLELRIVSWSIALDFSPSIAVARLASMTCALVVSEII